MTLQHNTRSRKTTDDFVWGWVVYIKNVNHWYINWADVFSYNERFKSFVVFSLFFSLASTLLYLRLIWSLWPIWNYAFVSSNFVTFELLALCSLRNSVVCWILCYFENLSYLDEPGLTILQWHNNKRGLVLIIIYHVKSDI